MISIAYKLCNNSEERAYYLCNSVKQDHIAQKPCILLKDMEVYLLLSAKVHNEERAYYLCNSVKQDHIAQKPCILLKDMEVYLLLSAKGHNVSC